MYNKEQAKGMHFNLITTHDPGEEREKGYSQYEQNKSKTDNDTVRNIQRQFYFMKTAKIPVDVNIAVYGKIVLV